MRTKTMHYGTKPDHSAMMIRRDSLVTPKTTLTCAQKPTCACRSSAFAYAESRSSSIVIVIVVSTTSSLSLANSAAYASLVFNIFFIEIVLSFTLVPSKDLFYLESWRIKLKENIYFEREMWRAYIIRMKWDLFYLTLEPSFHLHLKAETSSFVTRWFSISVAEFWVFGFRIW